jgi:micrococcal nuclease
LQSIIPKNRAFKYLLIGLQAAWMLGLSVSALSAEITYFYDGDTVKIVDAGYAYKLRLTDIDAPERNQAYGKKSRRALMQLCSGANVQVYLSGTDKYQRKLGKLVCNNIDASEFMVANGHAWFNARYSIDGGLAFKEQQARSQQLGLWGLQTQTPPWVWRKNHSH